ncbi:dihydropteroate synthase [Neoactinobaculum massilliense]|uniref:dihydropteroate synthase n=1 Tax=Neoactinobaculum massilliense TaxID=2364794 RepID=UPI001F14E5F7|nr:dihydropteroate synthase [Neoactinobaculum massilliense]
MARTLVMGIVNVTPDSFSDGGRWLGADAAIAHGRALIAAGADILDIGGESTRPDATPVSPAEEWHRIGPVIAELAGEIPLSVDTYHAETARRAVAAGASIINDVTTGAGDPDMFATVAAAGVTYILQHGRGNARTMTSLATYHDVAAEVRSEVADAVARAVAAGVAREKIIVDPGFGFAKMAPQDWELAARIDEFLSLGRTLVGVSRKGFLSEVSNGAPAPQRDAATAAFSTYFAEHGVWGVRVHNVAASRAAVETVARLEQERIRRAGNEEAGTVKEES